MQFCNHCSNEAVFSCNCTKPGILCLKHFNIHKLQVSGIHIPDLIFSSNSVLAGIQLALTALYKDVLTEAKGAMEVIRHKASQDLALIKSLQNISQKKYSEKLLLQIGSLKPFDDQIKKEGTFFSFHFEKFIESLKKIQVEINSRVRIQSNNLREQNLIDEPNAKINLPINNNRPPNSSSGLNSSQPASELGRNSSINPSQRNVNSGIRGNKDKIKIAEIKNDGFNERNNQYRSRK
ncbi:hypothetical protein SteCoe_21331 [Stentor coeruleus]|uniref:Uncharacterized protein n=1 Tax=Stentor coeruleus TaxID=5963 RepID=A0A1R2BPR7_9CILI|nr:hypothetical protein SteCoe_21331 [Stentor coeruleus]